MNIKFQKNLQTTFRVVPLADLHFFGQNDVAKNLNWLSEDAKALICYLAHITILISSDNGLTSSIQTT